MADQRIEPILAESARPTAVAIPAPVGVSVPGFRRRTIITGVCPTNFAIAYNDGACPTSPNVEAKLVTVMVRMKDPGSSNTDVQTLPVVLSTILVKK